jgi:hypothetical protein
MRKCPTCQTVYADDSLSYCLTDGTALAIFRDPEETLPAYDPNATLVYPTAPPTNPTLNDTRPSPPERIAIPVQTAPPPVSAAPPTVIKQGVSPVIVGALVGLLILAGGGLAFFALRDWQTTTPATTASNTAGEKPAPTVAPTREPIANSSNRNTAADANTPPRIDNTAANRPAPPVEERRTPPGRFPQTSTRSLAGEDLQDLDCDELKIMRNEIYARHGYIFQTQDMISYFSRQSWYRGVSRNVSAQITEREKSNLIVIQSYEEAVGCK